MSSFMKKWVIIYLTFLFSHQTFAAKEQLIFALDLIRHGARTATSDLPNAPQPWTEGKGQLTALGMRQEYQLGLKLNQRYTVDNQLLSPNYQANTIYIRSTDYDRTIMSAQAVLMGLYPLGTGPSLPDSTPALPYSFQPVPVHTVPAAQDSALLINLHTSEVSDLLNTYIYSRTDWKAKSAELSPHYNRWSQLTGVTIDDMFDVLSVGDTIHTYVAHNLPLPSGLSNEEATEIIEAADWIHATLFKPQEIGDVVGKAALQKITDYIQLAVDHKSTTKFVLLSAHDVTLLGVMSALHAPLNSSPDYASDLNFSVYQSESDNYYVKVTLNDKPVSIPGCNDNICQLNQLMSKVS